MNGYLGRIVASVAAAGLLGAVGVYAKQGRIEERVDSNKEHIAENAKQINKLETQQREALKEQTDMFREIMDKLNER